MIDYIESLIGMDIYYILLMSIIMLIGFTATLIHNKGLPIVWTSLITAIFYYKYEIFYPILIRWYYLPTDSLYFYIGGIYTISTLILLGMCLKNVLYNGEVIN